MTAESTNDQTRKNARPRRGRRDGGFTFVETVLTVVLMGIVVVPVLAAVRGAVRASALSQQAAEVETVLINAADEIHRAAVDDCDLTDDAADALPSSWEGRGLIRVEQHYLDVYGEWKEGAGPSCPDAGPTANMARRVRVTVTSPGGSIERFIQVVKSDV